jgi:hypothetical protein
MRAGRFQEGIPPGINLEGRTLGLVGLGRIGAYMARYGQALGMRVLAWSQNLTDEKAKAAGAERVDKERLFAESDAVSVHLVLGPRSRGLIGAADFARMKKGAIFINTSRGPIVDEEALIAALREDASSPRSMCMTSSRCRGTIRCAICPHIICVYWCVLVCVFSDPPARTLLCVTRVSSIHPPLNP